MTDKNNTEPFIINLSEYTRPEVIEDKRKEWVAYGEDNDYFNYVIQRYIGSTTNQSIINGITRLIYGQGLSATDNGEKQGQWAEVVSRLRPKDQKQIIFDRKTLGMAALQVTYNKSKVSKVTHFPMQTLRAEKCNENGEIEAWYYHPDWKDIKRSDKPKRIPAFGFGNKKGNEIYIWSTYVSGYDYYSPLDYQGALPYAVLEEEISDYLINDTINGFSGTKVVNFNNGVPEKEKREIIEAKVKSQLTGTKGKKVIVSFNQDQDKKTIVDDIPLNDAPSHYQYLSDECRNKLIIGHRITSPILLGIRDGNNGLGNNADEIKNASLVLENTNVKSYQQEFCDIISEIFAINGITLDLYFKTIQPLQFMEVDDLNVSGDEKEKQTGVELESQSNLDTTIADKLISCGEDINAEEWELIDERDVDYGIEDALDMQIEEWNKPKLNYFQKLAKTIKTGTARPNSKSAQDKEIKGVNYKVRYEYYPKRVSANSREFCKKMVSANKLYRKEDIIRMSDQVVNEGFGEFGADKYSIWKYKGGARCKHKWRRKTFAKVGSVDTRSPNAPTIGTSTAKKRGYKVQNDWEVSVAPNNMPLKGFSPNNKNLPSDVR